MLSETRLSHVSSAGRLGEAPTGQYALGYCSNLFDFRTLFPKKYLMGVMFWGAHSIIPPCHPVLSAFTPFMTGDSPHRHPQSPIPLWERAG